jgi:hypothetical protein
MQPSPMAETSRRPVPNARTYIVCSCVVADVLPVSIPPHPEGRPAAGICHRDLGAEGHAHGPLNDLVAESPPVQRRQPKKTLGLMRIV